MWHVIYQDKTYHHNIHHNNGCWFFTLNMFRPSTSSPEKHQATGWGGKAAKYGRKNQPRVALGKGLGGWRPQKIWHCISENMGLEPPNSFFLLTIELLNWNVNHDKNIWINKNCPAAWNNTPLPKYGVASSANQIHLWWKTLSLSTFCGHRCLVYFQDMRRNHPKDDRSPDALGQRRITFGAHNLQNDHLTGLHTSPNGRNFPSSIPHPPCGFHVSFFSEFLLKWGCTIIHHHIPHKNVLLVKIGLGPFHIPSIILYLLGLSG